MQINAVSTKATTFGHKPSREELEQFAAADDRELKYVARQVASAQVNDKKHAAINNALWYSLPIASGLASIVRNPKVVGRIPKLKLFATNAAIIGGTLAVVDGTFAAARSLNKHSDSVKEFNQEHPVISTLATLGAAVGVLFLADKGVTKLYEKYGKQAIKFLKDKKVDKFIKENKYVTKVMNYIRKAPSAIKEFAKTAVDWSPIVLIGTAIGHTFGHERARTVAEVRNYDALKHNQEKVRDFLDRTDAAEE